MSPREWRERAADILEAITEIQCFVANMTREQFAADAKTVKAVLADFAIIGEAANHLPPDVTALAPDIEWKLIRRMRNIIVHSYFGIDLGVVWQTIGEDLPELGRELRRLLAEAPPSPDEAK